MSARKSITRSKQTFRVKFPSQKNKQMVCCESLLEADAAQFLEISPHVKSFIAQPSEERYYDADGKPRRYFPDFAVTLHDDSTVDVEVKPEHKLSDPVVGNKIKAVVTRYEEMDRRFRVLTDRFLRSEPLRSNLSLISRHTRIPVDRKELKALKRRAASAEFKTFEEASKALGGDLGVYRLIRDGFLTIDFKQALGKTSRVWIRLTGESDDPLRI